MTVRTAHHAPATLLMAAAIAGCSTTDEPASEPEHTSAPTQAPAVPSASPEQAVEDAYVRFWHQTMHADDTPEHTWRDTVAAVAMDPQLTTTLDAMRDQKRSGITIYGDVTARIVSVEVAGDTATVVDCQDASRTGQADAVTGDRKTVGVKRNPVDAVVKRDTKDGQWKVSQVSFPGGTC